MSGISVRPRARPTGLRAGWLFDSSDATLKPDPLVVLLDGSIVSVGFGVVPGPEVEVVDLGTATLLPGLVDTHVHLALDASPDPVASLAARSDDEVLAAMGSAAQVALAGGVTTVRDLGDRDYLSLRLRGTPGLPTLLTAGPPITTAGGHCHFLGGAAEPGPEGLRAAVRDHVERGVDVIKIMASGGQLTPGTCQHQPQFSRTELSAAVDEAHRHGLRITAHAHARQAIVDAVAVGVDGLEHASFWSEDGVDEPGEVIGLLADSGVVVGATLGLRPVPGFVPPPEVLKRMPAIIANTRRMQQEGVRIVAGTDAGIAPVKPHDVLRYAVTQLLDLGMSGAQALRTITADAAEVCGQADRKGRIAVGYDADLLAVDGDPTTDSAALHRIVAVYAGGERVGRPGT